MSDHATPRTPRIALYGGSFDPPHVGHLLATAYVSAASQVDSVWLMPCFTHAFGKVLAPFEHRRAMCEAVASLFAPGRVAVTDVEARIGGTSRTIDTVRRLYAESPDARFDLVVGTDIFNDRASWKSFDELERLCRFIVVARPGFPAPEGYATSPELPDVSSTDVRRRVRANESIVGLVPDAVAAWVAEHGLYR